MDPVLTLLLTNLQQGLTQLEQALLDTLDLKFRISRDTEKQGKWFLGPERAEITQ